MKMLKDLKTSSKLFLSFGLMVALLAGVSGIALNNLEALHTQQNRLFKQDMALAIDLFELRTTINRERVELLTMAAGAAGSFDRSRARQEADSRHVAEVMARVEQRYGSAPDAGTALTGLRSALQEYTSVRDRAVLPSLRDGNRSAALAAATGALQERFDRLREVADELGERSIAQAQHQMDASSRMVDTSKSTLALANVVALAIGVALVLLLDRVIAAPLRRAMEVAQQIAGGNLAVAIPRTGARDEVGQMLAALDAMVRELTLIMKDTAAGISSLAAASSEILATSMQGSASSSETAAAVAETSATVEEVKQTAMLASQKARAVADAAQQAAATAEAGREAIDSGVEGMDTIQQQMESIGETIVRLSERSQAIAEIIATVSGLAEQSNLLAVNAAIEAAKAGESGRGFAVVAQEVRGLADQSKQATRQVRQILSEIEKAIGTAVMTAEQSTRTVARGAEQTTRAGHAIKSLADSIGDAAQAAAQIAASSQQQLAGMDQVTLAMENIKQASADNAAGSRQSEGAAHNLHELGLQLKRTSERFRFE